MAAKNPNPTDGKTDHDKPGLGRGVAALQGCVQEAILTAAAGSVVVTVGMRLILKHFGQW